MVTDRVYKDSPANIYIYLAHHQPESVPVIIIIIQGLMRKFLAA